MSTINWDAPKFPPLPSANEPALKVDMTRSEYNTIIMNQTLVMDPTI